MRIVAMLHRNREVGFTVMREALGLTDGNLGSHAGKLIEAGYLTQRRAVTARGVELRYRLTAQGTAALLEYIRELEALLGREG